MFLLFVFMCLGSVQWPDQSWPTSKYQSPSSVSSRTGRTGVTGTWALMVSGSSGSVREATGRLPPSSRKCLCLRYELFPVVIILTSGYPRAGTRPRLSTVCWGRGDSREWWLLMWGDQSDSWDTSQRWSLSPTKTMSTTAGNTLQQSNIIGTKASSIVIRTRSQGEHWHLPPAPAPVMCSPLTLPVSCSFLQETSSQYLRSIWDTVTLQTVSWTQDPHHHSHQWYHYQCLLLTNLA